MKLIPDDRPRVQATVIDRVVGFFSPRAGLERFKARQEMAVVGGYEGARRRRKRGTQNWTPPSGSADADVLPDLPDIRARARDLVRNVPVAAGAIATVGSNVIGDGLKLNAAVDRVALGMSQEQAKAWQDQAEREWALFCASADFTRIQSLFELQGLVFRSTLESGDVLVVRRYRKDVGDAYGTKLQLLEADRVSNPNWATDTDTIAGGVEVDKDGRPTAYHFTDKHPGNLRRPAMKWQRLPARTADGRPVVLHLYDRMRPEQTRGIPYLAPVIEYLKQLGDYSDAEVRAAVLTSYVTWFVERPAVEDGDTQPSPIGEVDSSLASNEVKLGSGALVDLGIGEKVSNPQPTRPNPQFEPFMLAFLRQIGVALELPFELLVKHFTASYSASRAALEMAWQFFRRRRTWVIRALMQPLYEWMLEEAVASGRIEAPGFFDDPVIRQAYCGATWIGPPRPIVNPEIEAKTNEIDLRNGVTSRKEIRTERFGDREDYDTVHEQLVFEEERRGKDGLSSSNTRAQPSEGNANNDDDDDTEDETQPARGRA